MMMTKSKRIRIAMMIILIFRTRKAGRSRRKAGGTRSWVVSLPLIVRTSSRALCPTTPTCTTDRSAWYLSSLFGNLSKLFFSLSTRWPTATSAVGWPQGIPKNLTGSRRGCRLFMQVFICCLLFVFVCCFVFVFVFVVVVCCCFVFVFVGWPQGIPKNLTGSRRGCRFPLF